MFYGLYKTKITAKYAKIEKLGNARNMVQEPLTG